MEFDAKRFSTLDWVIVAGAVIAFIAAFLPWYGATVGPFTRRSAAGRPVSRRGRVRCS